MKYLIDIFIQPSVVFRNIKEKPEWFKPLAFVIGMLCIISILNIALNRDLIMEQQIEAMRKRNMTEEQIDQALRYTSGPIVYVSTVFGTVLGVSIILLLFALLVNIFIPIAGGTGSYKLVFSVVTHSALIKIPAHLLRLILILIKNSLQVSTSLALFTPNLPSNSLVYQLLSSFDFFIVWEMILVAMGISITNDTKKEHAYILVFGIWLASVFLGIGIGTFFGAR